MGAMSPSQFAPVSQFASTPSPSQTGMPDPVVKVSRSSLPSAVTLNRPPSRAGWNSEASTTNRLTLKPVTAVAPRRMVQA